MTCSVDGCGRTDRITNGWCLMHYRRWRKHGSTFLEARRHVGSTCPTSDGYVRVWAPDHPQATKDGYALEHRLVLHDSGVLVRPEDHVHHRNHIRDDNRLENLEVLTPQEHARHHNALHFDVVEAARLYAQGMSTPALGLHFGVGPSNIYRSLVRHGYKLRTLKESRGLRVASADRSTA